MAVVKKQTDTEYIVSNLRFGKNIMGWWEVKFTCADGFCYGISDSCGGRAVKNKLKERILDRVLNQTEHPIQKVVNKSEKSSCKSL